MTLDDSETGRVFVLSSIDFTAYLWRIHVSKMRNQSVTDRLNSLVSLSAVKRVGEKSDLNILVFDFFKTRTSLEEFVFSLKSVQAIISLH